MNFSINRVYIYSLMVLISLASISFSQENVSNTLSIETKRVDLNGCIPMYHQKNFVIKDSKSYLNNIRTDAQTKRCTNNAKNLDFETYSYLGLKIHSGYCRYPKGLEYNVIKDNALEQYVLTASYIDPKNQVCRAFSQYDLWLQVPRLKENFKVIFQITLKPHNN